jgi:hypothetical protein
VFEDAQVLHRTPLTALAAAQFSTRRPILRIDYYGVDASQTPLGLFVPGLAWRPMEHVVLPLALSRICTEHARRSQLKQRSTRLDTEVGTRLDTEVGTRLDTEVGTRLDTEVGTRLDTEVGTRLDTEVGTMTEPESPASGPTKGPTVAEFAAIDAYLGGGPHIRGEIGSLLGI